MQIALIRKIDFQFSNLMHSALVSIGGSGDEMFIHVQLIHSFLMKISGVEHIRFYNRKGIIRMEDAKHPFVYEVAQLVCSKLTEEMMSREELPLREV